MSGFLKMRLKWFRFCNRFIKAYDEGWLSPVDGHEIHYYQVGNPKGEPVIRFHGGPGGSARVIGAAEFDLKRQRVISFDQRGCGLTRSEDPFYKNNSQETVKDALRLLNHLGIKDKVVVAGGSFGAALAILFAETYPNRVKRLCVDRVFLGRREDMENTTPSAAMFYPDAVDTVKEVAKGKEVNSFYGQLLFSNKRSDIEKAVRYYCRLERMVSHTWRNVEFPKVELSEKALIRHRIFALYIMNNMFLRENQLLKDAKKIRHIPTEIVQNRFDFCCPPAQAWALHKALPKSKITILPMHGHGGDYMSYFVHQINKNRK